MRRQNIPGTSFHIGDTVVFNGVYSRQALLAAMAADGIYEEDAEDFLTWGEMEIIGYDLPNGDEAEDALIAADVRLSVTDVRLSVTPADGSSDMSWYLTSIYFVPAVWPTLLLVTEE